MMITREILLDAMKEDKELEKLVFGYGGVDRAVAGMNVVVPVFESILKGVTNFVEEFKKGFNQSKEERLAKSFIDDVNAAIDKYGEEVVFEEEESLFERSLAMCDIDIKWRYEYLDSLLCDLEDESMELYEEIERAKIDEEIAHTLIDDYDVDVRNDLIYANKKVVSLTRELEELECRISAVNDLYDQVFFGIMSNLDVVKMNDNNESVVNKLFFWED